MCDFCEGRKTVSLSNINNVQSTAEVFQSKYLVVEDGSRRYTYDLCFCPECGRQLNYHAWEKVYVKNISEDKMIWSDPENSDEEEHSLHRLICDKYKENGILEAEQVPFIVSGRQVLSIREKGYCYLFCTKACPQDE